MANELSIGLLMAVCSLVGVVTNWIIVVVMYKVTKLRQPFSMLTVALASVDATFSTLYLFYATPMVLFDIRILQTWSSACGYLLMICYDAGTIVHFVISLNRFLAVFTPILYHRIFSQTFTKYIIFFIFLYTFVIITLFFQILGCQNYYNPEAVAFRYSSQTICQLYATYGDFYEVFSLTVLSAFLDLVTIRKVLKIREKSERSRKELNFLKQSIAQTTFVLTIVICFTWGPRLIPGKEYAFIFSSILWLSVHSFDGIFTLIFNGEIRRKLTSSKTTMVKPSAVSTFQRSVQ